MTFLLPCAKEVLDEVKKRYDYGELPSIFSFYLDRDLSKTL